jgi:hypothetical protein
MIVIIDNWMSSGSMSVILLGLLLPKCVSFIAFVGRAAVSVAKCQVEYVFLHLFYNLFQIWWLIFNNQLILLDLRYEMRVLLELLGKSNGLFYILDPLLGSLFVLAGI